MLVCLGRSKYQNEVNHFIMVRSGYVTQTIPSTHMGETREVALSFLRSTNSPIQSVNYNSVYDERRLFKNKFAETVRT